MSHNELSSLLALLREHNVLLYKTPELELHMGQALSEFPKESVAEREKREEEEDEDVTFAHVE